MEGGCMRPNLTKNIRIQDFKDFYWLKGELQLFCRENELPVSDSKIEISERIEMYLQTGEKSEPIKQVQVYAKRETQEKALSLDTIIIENHLRSQEVREFFKTVIPAFHFTTHI